MNAPRFDWGAPEPGCADCGCGGGCADGPPHMPRGAWSEADDNLDGLQPPKRPGPVPDWDPDEHDGDSANGRSVATYLPFGQWALATDPDVIDMGLPNISMDVFFSAGPSDGSPPFGCSYRIMEDAGYEAVCSLYRVRLTPTRIGRPIVSVWRIKAASNGNRDRFQPALAPDGKKLAYTIRYRDSVTKKKDSTTKIPTAPHAIGVKDLDTLEFAKVDSVEADQNGGLQHPAWYNEDVLTWTEVGGGENASDSVDGLRLAGVKSGATVTHDRPFAVLGANAGISSRRAIDNDSLQDVVDFADGDRQPFSVANNAGDRVLVLHSKDFEGSDSSGGEQGAVPIVVKLPADTKSTIYYERFELGSRPNGGARVGECHHPTWSTNNEVMCHDQTGEQRDGVTWREQLIYSKVDMNESVWYPKDSPTHQRAFAFQFTLPQLHSDFRHAFGHAFGAFGLKPGSVSHKYSQFLQNSRYIVTTTMVGNRSDINKSTKGFSRVALVDTQSSTLVDLTLLVESYEGAKKGGYGAFAPTAGPGSR
jgi:hypothetical protein